METVTNLRIAAVMVVGVEFAPLADLQVETEYKSLSLVFWLRNSLRHFQKIVEVSLHQPPQPYNYNIKTAYGRAGRSFTERVPKLVIAALLSVTNGMAWTVSVTSQPAGRLTEIAPTLTFSDVMSRLMRF